MAMLQGKRIPPEEEEAYTARGRGSVYLLRKIFGIQKHNTYLKETGLYYGRKTPKKKKHPQKNEQISLDEIKYNEYIKIFECKTIKKISTHTLLISINSISIVKDNFLLRSLGIALIVRLYLNSCKSFLIFSTQIYM